MALAGALSTTETFAQTPYNTISGIVWNDGVTGNGIRATGEPRIGGVLVAMLDAADNDTIAVAISDSTGAFTLNNFEGAGTYYLNYAFPAGGYDLANLQQGSDSTVSSAADPATLGFFDPNIVSTPNFTISSATAMAGYGIGLKPYNNTITHWRVKPVTATAWTQTFSFPQSDNGVGTINKVTIFATDAVRHPSIGLENTGASAEFAQVECNGRVSIDIPAGTDFQTNSLDKRAQTLAAFDGNINYAGASGMTWNEGSGYGFFSREITNGTQLNTYRSATPGTFNISASASSVTSIIGSGNLTASVFTNAGAGVFVTYHYTSVVLSVRLLSFQATKAGSAAKLTWETATEEATNGYAVQRSTNGSDFSEIGFVSAPARMDATQQFAFTDAQPLAGVNVYRLKEVDASGAAVYSTMRTVDFVDGTAAPAAYPNPADAFVMVDADATAKIVLYSPTGQVVAADVSFRGGKAVINTKALPAGVYSLQIVRAGHTSAQRLAVQHP